MNINNGDTDMKTQAKFINDFKKLHDIDYRKEQFLDNQYGSSPCFNYDRAGEIVQSLNNELAKQFDDQLVIYNLSMDIESLRTTKLKTYIECRVNNYYNLNSLNN